MSSLDSPLEVGPLSPTRFVDRPNRFVIRCRDRRRGTITAFLPNPGRLWELLLPGATVYVSSSRDDASPRGSRRKTQHTAIAVQRDGSPVFLHTHLTNRVARWLIENQRIPKLADARVLRSEVTVGRSRFDFLLEQGGQNVYLEVKSCTLFGNGVAMFPDAITERGRRHLSELASLGRGGVRPIVLLLVHTPRVRWFMPDYHTDLAFSQTFLSVRNRLRIWPIALHWNHDLTLSPDVKRLAIPWGYLRREVKDRGSYLVVMRLNRTRRIQVGKLGAFTFRSGYYVYVGSAMRNLSARIARHVRRTKTMRWHIDYLTEHAERPIAVPIRASRREECQIARCLVALYSPGPAGFGSSDCRCPCHVFWHARNPLQSPEFHGVLQRFRMRSPDS